MWKKDKKGGFHAQKKSINNIKIKKLKFPKCQECKENIEFCNKQINLLEN